MSPSGSGPATTAAPMPVPAREFSATLRVAVLAANFGPSLTFVTLIVTGTT